MRKMKGALPAALMNPLPVAVGKGKKGTTIQKTAAIGGQSGFHQHLTGAMKAGGKSIKCP